MKRSTSRILTTHAGSLARPERLRQMLAARDNRETHDPGALNRCLREAVSAAVQLQSQCGLDIINDGELSKTSFSGYVRYRLGGIDPEPSVPYTASTSARDALAFPDYFAGRARFSQRVAGARRMLVACTGPLRYTGQAALQADIDHFKSALRGVEVEEAFLPSVAPGTIEHWLKNKYYPDDEAYLYAIADAMHEEYQAIVNAGFLLQIDDPDLADGWQINAQMNVDEYLDFAALRIDALNRALKGIDPEKVRFHMCWGSYHGPHKFDIPLKTIVHLILKVNAGAYSIEASNPCHAHEWRVWADVKLPAGKVLIPGVVGHASDFIEHPELVAERLVRYAELVGRENIIAGTDCGLGPRVGHPEIAWAKFAAMVEGARIATKHLWRE